MAVGIDSIAIVALPLQGGFRRADDHFLLYDRVVAAVNEGGGGASSDMIDSLDHLKRTIFK